MLTRRETAADWLPSWDAWPLVYPSNMSTTAAASVAPAVADSACIEAIETEPLPASFGGISWSPPSRPVAPSRPASLQLSVCTSQDWPALQVRRRVSAAPCGITLKPDIHLVSSTDRDRVRQYA